MGDQDLDYAPAQVSTQDPSQVAVEGPKRRRGRPHSSTKPPGQVVVDTPKRRRGRLRDPTKQPFAPLTPGRRPSVALCYIAVLWCYS